MATDVMTINDKAAEFRANAEACGLEARRGPQMDAYVTNSINGNGTSKFDNVTQVMSARDAACMKIPGSVDEMTSADRLKNWLKTSFVNAKEAAGQSLEDAVALGRGAQKIIADPAAAIESGQKAYDTSVGSGRINRAVDGPMSLK